MYMGYEFRLYRSSAARVSDQQVEKNVNSEQDHEKAFSLVLLSEVNSKSNHQGSQPLLSKLASSTRPPPFRRVQPKPSLILQTGIPVVTCAQRPPCFASWSRKAC